MPQVRQLRNAEAHDRLTRALQPREVGRQRNVGRPASLDRHEQPVGAVVLGREARFLDDGHDPAADLPRAFRHQLFQPVGERCERAGGVERELVPAGGRHLAEDGGESEGRVLRDGDRRADIRCHRSGPVEDRSDIDSGEGRRDEPKVSESGVPTPDGRDGRERFPKVSFLRQPLERGPGVRDREEVPPRGSAQVAQHVPEVVEEGEWLGRGPRLAGDDEQGVPRVDPPAHRGHGVGVGTVENQQFRESALVLEHSGEDVGGEARTPHPEDDHVPDPFGANFVRERNEFADLMMHRLRETEPAHPLSHVRRRGGGPEAGVALPDPIAHVRLLPGSDPGRHARRGRTETPGQRVDRTREERVLLRVERFQEVFVGGTEQGDALDLEVVRDLREVDPEPRQPIEEGPRLGNPAYDRTGPDHTVVLERGEGRRRDGVHRVRPDELLDVHRVPVR